MKKTADTLWAELDRLRGKRILDINALVEAARRHWAKGRPKDTLCFPPSHEPEFARICVAQLSC